MLVGPVLFLAPLPAVLIAVPVAIFWQRGNIISSYLAKFLFWQFHPPCWNNLHNIYRIKCFCSFFSSTQQYYTWWKADTPFFHRWVLHRVVISFDLFCQWDPPRWGHGCVSQHFCSPEALLTHDVIADRFHEASRLLPSAYLNYELLGKAIRSPHALSPPLQALPALGKGQHILFSSLPSLSAHCLNGTQQFSPVVTRAFVSPKADLSPQS